MQCTARFLLRQSFDRRNFEKFDSASGRMLTLADNSWDKGTLPKSSGRGQSSIRWRPLRRWGGPSAVGGRGQRRAGQAGSHAPERLGEARNSAPDALGEPRADSGGGSGRAARPGEPRVTHFRPVSSAFKGSSP